MTIRIGNAPCSWGVEFANDPRNPPWRQVVRENAEAGYRGIELGPVGFMPEDPALLGDALAEHDLELIGGVVFRPFHDPDAWDDVLDGSVRTCKALVAHGAQHLVLIDSISPRRAPTAGRVSEAEQMDAAEWAAYRDRIAQVARMGAEDYGLTVGIHAHAAGFMDFEPELERLLDEIDEKILKICFDTGHHSYAGFDPVAFMKRYMDRISYVHFKDIDPKVKADVIARRTGFYDACAQGIFCNLGDGDVDFPNVRQVLLDAAFEGWCTVEQDCDPA
ncbi:MAG: TIM barrel protein, partial [Pseudomonadota bacterium]